MFRWLLLPLLLVPLLAIVGPQERRTASVACVEESVAAFAPAPLAPASLDAGPAALLAAHGELLRLRTTIAGANTRPLRSGSASGGPGPDSAPAAAAVIAHLGYARALHRSRLNTPTTYGNPPPLPVS